MRRITEEQLDSMLKNYCERTAQTAFQKTEARRFPAKRVALAAAVVLIIAIGAAAFWLTAASPRHEKNAYSFSAEKLAAFCRQESVADKTAQQKAGAWEPVLAYADSHKAVFGVAKGVFVFDYQKGEFLNTFDLEKIGVPAFGQGDNISSLSASADGKFALLYSHMTLENGGYREEYRELNLETGEITLLDNEKAFIEKHGVFQTCPVNVSDREKLPGWLFSGHSAVVEANEYILAFDFDQGKGRLDTLSLMIMNAQSGEIKSVVSVFKNNN